jgi:hypothetical protein
MALRLRLGSAARRDGHARALFGYGSKLASVHVDEPHVRPVIADEYEVAHADEPT